MGKRALFLDRDGTLIAERGHLSDPKKVVFFPETAGALYRLRNHFLFFLVTNQGGVAEGKISLQEAGRVNQYVVHWLGESGVTISDVYCCPHSRDDGCECIKPKPHFLQKAAREYGVDLQRSFVIGDHPHDVELAINAGAQGIYVLSGHGKKHRNRLNVPCWIVNNLPEAVDLVVKAMSL